MNVKNRINIDNKLIVLLAILSIGLFLRIYDLSGESIWLDESASVHFASLNFSDIFFLRGEKNPPLYYIILHWWINLFGDSEFSIRFPSVIFGSLSIFMIYKVGNQICDKDVGILGSFLLGLSVFHIRYSQEARMYSLSFLLTLLSIYFFIRFFKDRSCKVLISYILFSILLMYSHIYGLFIIISQNIYLIVLFFSSNELFSLNIKRWILTQFLLIVLFIPWIKIFITLTFGVVKDGLWLPIPSLLSIVKSFGAYSGGILLFLLFLILLSFSIIKYEGISGNIDRRNISKSIKSYFRKIRLLNINEILLLLVWLLTPIILPFTISLFSTPIYTTKYTIVASPAFYLLIAKGINNISHKYLKSIIISVIIIISLVYIREYYINIDKEQWRDVASYIDDNAKNGDLLLFNAAGQIVFDYYSKRTSLIKNHFSEKNIKGLETAVEGYKRVWVIWRVQSIHRQVQQHPWLSKWVLQYSKDEKSLVTKKLIEAYNLPYQRKYVGIKMALFERKE